MLKVAEIGEHSPVAAADTILRHPLFQRGQFVAKSERTDDPTKTKLQTRRHTHARKPNQRR